MVRTSIEKRLWSLKLNSVNFFQQEKLPRATLFGLITRGDVETLMKANFSDESKSELLSLARGRLGQEGFVLKAEDKVCPRENVLISDKSLADSAEALIGLFLSRS